MMVNLAMCSQSQLVLGHANVHMGTGRGLFTSAASPKLKREAAVVRPPNACDAQPRPIVACNLDSTPRGDMAPSKTEIRI